MQGMKLESKDERIEKLISILPIKNSRVSFMNLVQHISELQNGFQTKHICWVECKYDYIVGYLTL